MDKLTSTLHTALKTIVDSHGNMALIIAYSGGIDSQVLLHALMQLKQKKLIFNDITVCHVNHGLSKNAERWQNFAEQTCLNLAVKLIVKCVNVQPKAQQSLEALARDARYNALQSLTDKKSLILTGHHSDDQSETFLLALKRGAGLKGLASMSEQTQLGQHLLVRPLLSVSRQEIENYAENHSLVWIDDESNQDTSFDRNFIRQKIMPMLRARWPSINNTINRSASHCLAGQELLDELASQDLIHCKSSESSLSVFALKKLSPARFNNLIRFFMAQHHCLMPSTEQVNQVREQLKAKHDKTPQIKVANHFFRRFKGVLFLTPEYNDISDWQENIELFQNQSLIEDLTLSLPDKLGKLLFRTKTTFSGNRENNKRLPAILLPKQGQQVSIRFCHDNPKCLPHFRQHSRSVKKVLQELNIAPWQRKRIAFLYYDHELVAAVGLFICKPFIASDNEVSISILNNQTVNHD
ncbi:MAG: tRNA lysidine(34) synthetase TilS [Colwellia sp.]